MGAGRRFELDTKNSIMEHTADSVVALAPDYSSNSLYSVADIAVFYENDYGLTGTFLELKKRQATKGNRATVLSGSSVGQNGVDELQSLVDGTPPWANAAVVVKFNRKQAVVVEADQLLYAMENDMVMDDHGLEARPTKSKNISMRKAGRIPSQQSGKEPWRAICDGIGVRGSDINE